MQSLTHPLIAGLLVALLPLVAEAQPSRVDPAMDTCTDAFVRAQREQKADHLLAARDSYKACAATTCSALLQKECASRFASVGGAIPSVVFSFHVAHGDPIQEARVSIDGAADAIRKGGESSEVDPGAHAFVAIAPWGERASVTVNAEAGGSKNAVFAFEGAPAQVEKPPPPPPAATGTIPLGAYVVGAGGIVALGAFAGFGLAGTSQKNDLDATCAPTHSCKSSDVDGIRRDFLIANVSAGAGIVALGVAGYLAWRGLHPDRPPPPVSLGPRGARFSF